MQSNEFIVWSRFEWRGFYLGLALTSITEFAWDCADGMPLSKQTVLSYNFVFVARVHDTIVHRHLCKLCAKHSIVRAVTRADQIRPMPSCCLPATFGTTIVRVARLQPFNCACYTKPVISHETRCNGNKLYNCVPRAVGTKDVIR